MKKIHIILVLIILNISISCEKQSYTKDVLFLGDSHVFGWDIEYYFPYINYQKIGIGGARISDLIEYTKDDYKTAVIIAGTNDVVSYFNTKSDGYKQEFLQDYWSSIKNLDPAKVIVVSIFPMIEQNSKQGINEIIDEFNNMLKNMVDTTSNTLYLDVNTSLQSEDGQLDCSYADTKGVHLNNLGYELLSKLVSQKL